MLIPQLEKVYDQFQDHTRHKIEASSRVPPFTMKITDPPGMHFDELSEFPGVPRVPVSRNLSTNVATRGRSGEGGRMLH
jgi:hypothetical protein